ncbi:MAG: hypothetical protein ABIC57_01160 [bacterium]
METIVYTDDKSFNWLFDKYYFCGSNSRYWTFQMALNLLFQRKNSPVIVETGCQRQEDDLGAGMSTSIFGEYCSRHGGKLYTVDLIETHLNICRECTSEHSRNIEYVLSDSVAWLKKAARVNIDLLYLDSLDYPVGSQADDIRMQEAAQVHCLNEFKAAESSGKLKDNCLILIDDNQLPGGGKPRLLKQYLKAQGWTCLLDLQQSLWVRKL